MHSAAAYAVRLSVCHDPKRLNIDDISSSLSLKYTTLQLIRCVIYSALVGKVVTNAPINVTELAYRST